MALIILAHPNYQASLANKLIIEQLQKNSFDIEVRNIHQLYPNYQIDCKTEQEALLRHDTIVFQFPFYWYNIPAILKLWMDDVLTYQFAYGGEGNKLKNKTLLISTTIGQPESAYRTVPDTSPFTEVFFESLRHSAEYAQMIYGGALYSYELASVLTYSEAQRREKAIAHANKLEEKLKAIEQLKRSA